MSGTRKTPSDPVLDVLVKNTEALTSMNASLKTFMQEHVQTRQTARESGHSISAKLDNFDRTMEELRLAMEKSEAARQSELRQIYELLGQERQDRREVTNTQGKDEREMIRALLREEMGERRQERGFLVGAVKSVWAVGGKYIVAAVALTIAAAVMKLTGLSLGDILGLTGK